MQSNYKVRLTMTMDPYACKLVRCPQHPQTKDKSQKRRSNARKPNTTHQLSHPDPASPETPSKNAQYSRNTSRPHGTRLSMPNEKNLIIRVLFFLLFLIQHRKRLAILVTITKHRLIPAPPRPDPQEIIIRVILRRPMHKPE